MLSLVQATDAAHQGEKLVDAERWGNTDPPPRIDVARWVWQHEDPPSQMSFLPGAGDGSREVTAAYSWRRRWGRRGFELVGEMRPLS